MGSTIINRQAYSSSSWVKILCLAALLVLLTACGRSHPTNFYAFSSESWDLTQDQLPKTTIRIARIAVPQYLERENIVQRDGVALTVSSLNVWAEPLADGIRRLLYQDLTPHLLPENITVLPLSSGDNGRITLLVDIIHLDGKLGHTAALTAQWSIVESESNRVLDSGLFSAKKAVETTIASLVLAEEELIHDLSQHLVTRIPSAIKRR